MELPPQLEKFLQSIGVNTVRIKWKLREWEQNQEQRKRISQTKEAKTRYKNCRCGSMVLADDKVCEACGKKLPSYTVWRILEALKLNELEYGYSSVIFVMTCAFFFIWQVVVSQGKAIGGPTAELMNQFGAFIPVNFFAGEYWRILTMGLFHFGVMHIAFNSSAIISVLPHFEQEIGPWKTILLITVTQLTAMAAHFFTISEPYFVISEGIRYETGVTGGASGVAFGIIGFGIVMFHRNGRLTERNQFFMWLVFAILFTLFFDSINHAAHFGGFIGGVVLGFIFSIRQRTMMKFDFAINSLGAICLLFWIASIGFLFYNIVYGIFDKA